MTKRQLNTTYLSLRYKVKKLAKTYDTLLDTLDQSGQIYPWLFDSVSWMSTKKGRQGRLASLKFTKKFYTNRITRLKGLI